MDTSQRLKVSKRLSYQVDRSDDGSAPAALVQAMRQGARAFQRALCEGERLLLAINPKVGDGECQTPKFATFVLPDDGVGLAAFTSLTELEGCFPNHRPIPLPGKRIALLAISANALLVVDPPAGIVLPEPALMALAAGDTWLPPTEDEQLHNHVRQVCAHFGCHFLRFSATATGATLLRFEAESKEDATRACAALGQDQMVVARCAPLHLIPVLR